MDSDSDGGSEGEQRLLSLQPLGGDDDDNEHQDQPARHVKLGDFSFLPKELHLTTDAGPGRTDATRCENGLNLADSKLPLASGCGGVR